MTTYRQIFAFHKRKCSCSLNFCIFTWLKFRLVKLHVFTRITFPICSRIEIWNFIYKNLLWSHILYLKILVFCFVAVVLVFDVVCFWFVCFFRKGFKFHHFKNELGRLLWKRTVTLGLLRCKVFAQNQPDEQKFDSK